MCMDLAGVWQSACVCERGGSMAGFRSSAVYLGVKDIQGTLYKPTGYGGRGREAGGSVCQCSMNGPIQNQLWMG